VERFYAAADFFVFPTLYDPFPSVVLEAMASGLPVITTAQCGAAEIMEHGKDGFVLADPGESDRLAEYMNELSEVKTRSVMSRLARRKAENFPWQRTVDATLQLYRQLSPPPLPGPGKL
jgi:UDP-glucose:(heptosyl)LPS alpha-1,3-glucosyltransferase